MQRSVGASAATGRLGGRSPRIAGAILLGLAAVATAAPAGDGSRRASPAEVVRDNVAAAVNPIKVGVSYGFWLLGTLAYERGQDETALADFTEAIRLDPGNDAAYTGRAAVWDRKGERDRAIADLDQVIRLEPEDDSALVDAGGSGARRAGSTGPSWITARPSASTPETSRPTADAVGTGVNSGGTTRRWAITTRPSGSTRRLGRLTPVAPGLDRNEAVRPGHH